jgi:predicted acetyltransferase
VAIDVRLASESDLDGYYDELSLGFHFRPSPAELAVYRESLDLSRTRVAVDGPRVVATLHSWPTEFTVPGPRVVRASALTQVTVAPTHRRQGILTRMITQDLAESAGRGEALSILIASEYPIYGRFGYGPAIENAGYQIETTGLRRTASLEGRVEVSNWESLRIDGPALYERFRLSQPGSIERRPHWWGRLTRQLPVEGADSKHAFCVRHVAPDGTVEGYAVCSGSLEAPDMRHKGVLTVEELIAATPRAYRALWTFCAEVDLLTSVVAPNRAVEEPIGMLFHDARAVRQTHVFDFIWIRILDAVAALGGRDYGAHGRVVLGIDDPMGFAHGRYMLDVGPDGARCTETDRTPDLQLAVAALGSVYAGDVSVSSLVKAGWITVINPEVLPVADAMFRSASRSWCATWF